MNRRAFIGLLAALFSPLTSLFASNREVKLEPVGQDSDGKIKPLSELSHRREFRQVMKHRRLKNGVIEFTQSGESRGYGCCVPFVFYDRFQNEIVVTEAPGGVATWKYTCQLPPDFHPISDIGQGRLETVGPRDKEGDAQLERNLVPARTMIDYYLKEQRNSS